VNNVIAHPLRAIGFAKALKRKMNADCAKGIAELATAIGCLSDLASEPRFDFAGGFIREYEGVLVELEALDPDDPSCIESVVTLGRRLENLQTEFLQRIIAAGRFSP
jgi:hypothetical protein